jgi:hypothetical protein
MVGQSRALGDLRNPGLKGALRELLLKELFLPVFPSDLGAGTGVIITAFDEQSPQQDIVIYNKAILPPILVENAGAFPVESVLYSIEVKSHLTKDELRQCNHNARDLMKLRFTAGSHDANGSPIDHPVAGVMPVVFAFASDLTGLGKTEIDRLDEIRGIEAPGVRVICVIGGGYWFWSEVKNSWVSWKVVSEYDEVIGFLAGVTNSLHNIGATRRNPRFGRYLVDEREHAG